jgi:hypothetical protein
VAGARFDGKGLLPVHLLMTRMQQAPHGPDGRLLARGRTAWRLDTFED